MFKHFFRILLAVVIVYTMTGCNIVSASSQDPATETFTQATTSITQEATETHIDKFNISDVKIELINPIVLMEMKQEEVEALMEEMVRVSSTEELSISDILNMGHNFNNIVTFIKTIDIDNFNAQSIKAFDNVYNQCIKQQIPLEKVSSWTNLPVVEIQLKYFSGEFSSVEGIDCKSLYLLEESDAVMVTKAIFANPALFEKSAFIVYDTLMCPHTEVRKIGLSVLTRISKTSQPIDSSIAFNFCRILDTNSIVNDVLTLEKLNEIRQNIIENKNFDFVAKYLVFCNSNDEEVSNWSSSLLIEIAKHCDSETSDYIKKLADYLFDEAVANELLNLLEEASH